LAEAEALQLEEEAKGSNDPATEARAAAARSTAQQLKATAAARAADLARAEIGGSGWSQQLRRLSHLRTNAVRLAAADVVRARYQTAVDRLPVVAALLGLGVVTLALAPRPGGKLEGQASVAVVTLGLNDAGREVTGCNEATVDALRVGGTEAVPLLVTLPSRACPVARLVEFTVEGGTPLGSVEDAEPATAGPSPSGSG
jgi:hypothetical protein